MKEKRKLKIPSRVTRGSAPVPERLRFLDKTQMHAVLATSDGRKPYASIVAFAVTDELDGIVFATPRGTRKYRNILRNSSVSLLIDSRTNDESSYLSAESITIEGKARPIRRSGKRLHLTAVLTGKHPTLKQFVDNSNTALVLVDIRECLHVTRFQKVSKWSPPPARSTAG
jgi:nitroimidazol reductase NimA-like FMN-containing flavoprotein (pyridoxamine 5'-phosphate oxidase superfamily)